LANLFSLKPHRNFFPSKLFHVALGESDEMENARGEDFWKGFIYAFAQLKPSVTALVRLTA